MPAVRRFRSDDATEDQLLEIRRLLERAFPGDYSAEDWEHAQGGWHVVVEADGIVVAHAAVVARRLDVDAEPWRTGYVEAVATEPGRQRQGLGTMVMAEVAALITTEFELGGLSTGSHAFYERLGWVPWQGPTYVRRGDDVVRSEDDDDAIMVLCFDRSAAIERSAPISCEARAGDDW